MKIIFKCKTAVLTYRVHRLYTSTTLQLQFQTDKRRYNMAESSSSKPRKNHKSIRGQLAEIGVQTVEILEKKEYVVKDSENSIDLSSFLLESVNGSLLYNSEQLKKVASPKSNVVSTSFEVTEETTLAAAERLTREGYAGSVTCLNFASGKNPGGGFKSGARTQEESICRATALYATLVNHEGYYENNRKTRDGFYTDHLIWSPNVPVIRDFSLDEQPLIAEPWTLSFITMPAVNAGVVRNRNKEKDIESKIKDAMIRRIGYLLGVAAEKKQKALVLGAWGCGCFKNDPHVLASAFKHWLDGSGAPFSGVFERVVFAIYAPIKKEKENVDAFKALFTT